MSWFRALVHRRTLERQLDRELRFHIEQQMADYIAAGIPPEEARRRVRLEFGGMEQVKEECRDARSLHWLDAWRRDFHFAVRMLRKSPSFTLAAVVILALAIGANTITFSAINTLILKPLPVTRPAELVFLNTPGGPSQSYPNYIDFRDRTRTLSGLTAYRVAHVALGMNGNTAHAWCYEATGNYFDVLGVPAILGRTFTPAEDRTLGAHPLIVLSYASWQGRFNGDRHIVGETVKLNGMDYTIIGVTPRGFSGTERIFAPEFWVPMSMARQLEPGFDWIENRGAMNIWALGRLRRGVASPQAEAELNSIAAQLVREHPGVEGLRVELSPPGLVGNVFRGPVIGFASVLMGVAVLVLLIACTNLAGLLLARASDRQREIAIRLALGAGRLQLMRQLLAESLLLALAGGVAGLLLALWIVKLLAAWRMPIDFPAVTSLVVDARVLVFTVVLCLLTTLLFGLAPALAAVRGTLVPALKNGPASERLRRWQFRDVLAAAQIALSVVLLTGAVLVMRSLQRSVTINFGFNPHNAVAVSVDVGLQGYSEARGREFGRRLLEKVAALPGVQVAGITNWLPLGLGQSSTTVYAVEHRPPLRVTDSRSAQYYNISPGYLQAMQTRLIAGRDFDARDRRNSPRVAIVNEAFAAQMFARENAVGKRFQNDKDGPWIEVVGIVEDGKYRSLNDGPTPAIFWPRAQNYDFATTVVARSQLPAADVIRMIQRVIRELDPELPWFQAGSLDDHLKLVLFPARIAASMLGAFGGIAIVLAAAGIYGIMAYAVSRRTREIGIRVAMGATREQVLFGLVLRRAAVLLLIGTAAGAALAFVAGSLFTPILYGVNAHDPATFVLATVLMAVVALGACLAPARRAMKIDPALALREE